MKDGEWWVRARCINQKFHDYPTKIRSRQWGGRVKNNRFGRQEKGECGFRLTRTREKE